MFTTLRLTEPFWSLRQVLLAQDVEEQELSSMTMISMKHSKIFWNSVRSSQLMAQNSSRLV
jgi:hypothetical protein